MTEGYDSIYRAVEEAADELGRLDTTCALAPECASLALWTGTIAWFVELDPDALLAASPPLVDRIADDERRVRGGAPLTAARIDAWGGTPPEARLPSADAALETAPPDAGPLGAALGQLLAGPGRDRPAILHAADIAAVFAADDRRGEIAAALALCAAGRTDRIRLVPFAGVAAEERRAATAAWQRGDRAPWHEIALAALVGRARAMRREVERLMDASEDEEERLAPLGRAAITARLARDHLRDAFTCTMPSLAESLGVSRPAAGDALARLVQLGLARECTGKRRDRLFAYEAAWRLAARSALS